MTAVRTLAEVTALGQVAQDTYRLRLRAPEVASRAQPGQFVMLGPVRADSDDPFLLRPFSIHRVTPDGFLELLFAVVGRGTEALASLRPGQRLGLLGPQGKGFSPRAGPGTLVLAAGGLGVAPLVFLAEQEALRGRRVLFLYGARLAQRLVPLPELERQCVQLRLCSDDGSAGRKGTVTDMLAATLEAANPAAAEIVACGPVPMLKVAAAIGRARKLPVQLSLETRLACGTGACLGCAVDLAAGRLRVCVDGPVFSAEEVF